jgi:hypothetical protein
VEALREIKTPALTSPTTGAPTGRRPHPHRRAIEPAYEIYSGWGPRGILRRPAPGHRPQLQPTSPSIRAARFIWVSSAGATASRPAADSGITAFTPGLTLETLGRRWRSGGRSPPRGLKFLDDFHVKASAGLDRRFNQHETQKNFPAGDRRGSPRTAPLEKVEIAKREPITPKPSRRAPWIRC